MEAADEIPISISISKQQEDDRISFLKLFEQSMSIENLRANKSLCQNLDDNNLAIHIDDYLANPTINDTYQFTKSELIEAIRQSKLYSYDSATQMIKLNYKAKRRVIVFRDVPSEYQNPEDMKRFFALSNDYGKEYEMFIDKIESLGHGFMSVYFKSEDIAVEVFRWLENVKEESNGKVLFRISAFMKIENLKKDILGISNEDGAGVEFISNIILDPKHHIPRKLSANEEIVFRTSICPQEGTFPSLSKFDKFDPYSTNPTIKEFVKIIETKRKEGSTNPRKESFYNTLSKLPERSKSFSKKQCNYFDIQAPNMMTTTSSIPLNKDYQINLNEDLALHKSKQCGKMYSMKDITSTYINMTLLKKFEFPEEWKCDFLADVMTDQTKSNLDTWKQKKLSIVQDKNSSQRDRANTAYIHEKKKKTSFYKHKSGYGYDEEYGNLQRKDRLSSAI